MFEGQGFLVAQAERSAIFGEGVAGEIGQGACRGALIVELSEGFGVVQGQAVGDWRYGVAGGLGCCGGHCGMGCAGGFRG